MYHFLLETGLAGPTVALLVSAQLAAGAWVFWQRIQVARESRRGLPAELLRAFALQRAGIWHGSVRPLVSLLTLLGPAVGMAMSTALGAIGMSRLGQVIDAGGGEQAALLSEMAAAFVDVSNAYFVMVGGTLCLILGPVIMYVARPFEAAAQEVEGGDPEEQVLAELRGIRAALERRTWQAPRGAEARDDR